MKKLLFISAAFLMTATSFAQTEKKAAETKVTEAKVASKKEVKKGKISSKKDAKPVQSMDVKATPVVANEVEALKPAKLEDAPVQGGQVTPPPAPPVLLDNSKAFEFKNDAYDFGKIPAGKPAKYELFIKNISKETAELTLVQPGCGCTTPEYKQGEKFAPGETVKVTLGYNGGAPGNGSPFSKSVTVTLKGYTPKVVSFRGETYAVPTESAPANKTMEALKPAEETKH